jgi:hypothetical protein
MKYAEDSENRALQELDSIKAELIKIKEQNAALAAALEREIGLKTYFSGRADGLWTCYRCGSIGQHDQIIHKPECTVGTLQRSVAILARVRAEAKAEELERITAKHKRTIWVDGITHVNYADVTCAELMKRVMELGEDSVITWGDENEAPKGQIWVCAACGKSNSNRVNVGDESCFLNAVLCYDRGGILPWEAVELDATELRRGKL